MSKIVLLAGLAATLLAACGRGSGPGSGSVRLVVLSPATVDVAKVTVRISGTGISPSIAHELMLDQGQWKATIANIPAGTGRLFEVEVLNTPGDLIFEGRAENVTIVAGQTAMVTITAQPTTPPTPFENAAPVIDAVVVSSTQVLTGQTLSLAVTAHDSDAQDVLTYAWTSTGGTFDQPAAATTNWTAPTNASNQRVTIRVSDPKGLYAELSLDVVVAVAVGDASVTVRLNSWPTISQMTAVPARLEVGVPVALQAVAADDDGDTLMLAWGSDCTGTFSDTSATTTSFTLTTAPDDRSVCAVALNVADGHGGQTVGTLRLPVGSAPVPTIPDAGAPDTMPPAAPDAGAPDSTPESPDAGAPDATPASPDAGGDAPPVIEPDAAPGPDAATPADGAMACTTPFTLDGLTDARFWLVANQAVKQQKKLDVGCSLIEASKTYVGAARLQKVGTEWYFWWEEPNELLTFEMGTVTSRVYAPPPAYVPTSAPEKKGIPVNVVQTGTKLQVSALKDGSFGDYRRIADGDGRYLIAACSPFRFQTGLIELEDDSTYFSLTVDLVTGEITLDHQCAYHRLVSGCSQPSMTDLIKATGTLPCPGVDAGASCGAFSMEELADARFEQTSHVAPRTRYFLGRTARPGHGGQRPAGSALRRVRVSS